MSSIQLFGKKLGLNDVRGTMFYYFADILQDLKPKMFLVENVRGLLSHDNGRTLQTMVNVFTEVGYKVTYKVLNAVDYNVAQKRERLVIVGVRDDYEGITFGYPKPSENRLVLRDVLQDVPESEGIEYSEKKKGYWNSCHPVVVGATYQRRLPRNIWVKAIIPAG